ncbi:MAG: metal-dependent transcriptional regulator [Acidobacteria bacterium]|nr:metal-dependent transcriptional regulator [Acidobacteriota bacterium]
MSVGLLILGFVALTVAGAISLGARTQALWRHSRELRHREQLENALKHLLAGAADRQAVPLDQLAGALREPPATTRETVDHLYRERLAMADADGVRLTDAGVRLALQVVRAHRLWERYFADEADMPLARIHDAAERAEHRLTPEALEQLSAALGHPEIDPHGSPIPSSTGSLLAAEPAAAPALERAPVIPDDALPLSEWPAGQPAAIVALDTACRGFLRRRLLDLGFTPGTSIAPDLAPFAGDPRAYRLRGTTIALRRDQARRVLVRPR